jgi:quinolinate synthase
MKLNTLEKMYLALKFEQPEIVMDPLLLKKAEIPILRMLELSKQN